MAATWRSLCAAALLAGAVLPALAVELPRIHPGQWEVMTVLPGGEPFVHRECLADTFLSGSATSRTPENAGCTDRGVRQKGTTYTRELRCTTADGKTEIRRSQWTVKSAIYLINKSERTVHGKTEPIAQVELVRAGDCPAPSPKK